MPRAYCVADPMSDGSAFADELYEFAAGPAKPHTAIIIQPDLLHTLIEPFLAGETPQGTFEQ